jgi:hypothetical protein
MREITYRNKDSSEQSSTVFGSKRYGKRVFLFKLRLPVYLL